MKALISPQQDNLVVQVVENNNVFEVALPLYWVDCTNLIKPYEYKYENNEFISYILPAIISTTVSMRQARLSLFQVDLLDEVETAIANGTRADQITWEYATEVNRSDPLVENLSTALGLTEQQLDDLFMLASTL